MAQDFSKYKSPADEFKIAKTSQFWRLREHLQNVAREFKVTVKESSPSLHDGSTTWTFSPQVPAGATKLRQIELLAPGKRELCTAWFANGPFITQNSLSWPAGKSTPAVTLAIRGLDFPSTPKQARDYYQFFGVSADGKDFRATFVTGKQVPKQLRGHTKVFESDAGVLFWFGNTPPATPTVRRLLLNLARRVGKTKEFLFGLPQALRFLLTDSLVSLTRDLEFLNHAERSNKNSLAR